MQIFMLYFQLCFLQLSDIYIIDCYFQGECRNIVTVKKIIGKILAKTWLQTFATKDIELIWKWSATGNR